MDAAAGPGGSSPAPGRHSVVHLPRWWYVACLSRQLRDRPVARTVLGRPLALFRDESGRPVALLDRCPHRNVPLSLGRMDGGVLQCRYHGWRFDGRGSCVEVPGLCEDRVGAEPQDDRGGADRRARRATAFPAEERDGFVWVFPDGGAPPDHQPRPFPHVDTAGYVTVRRSLRVASTLHAAVENTLDVPHTAFLHAGLFRGRRAPVEVEVVVRPLPGGVEAEYVGEPLPPGIVGRVLAPGGGVVTHFDRFLLPSIAQVEYRLGRHHLLVTTAFTPVSDVDTRLHVAVTFRGALPAWLVRAVVTPVADRIFAQDREILRHQAETIGRFGGEAFVSTDLDVLGTRIWALLRRAERGEPAPAEVPERRLRMRI